MKFENELRLLRSNIKELMKDYNIEFVKNYIKNECREEYSKKLIGANLLLNNSFIFDETWDMEQCRIPYVNNPINWSFTPNGDEEWIFMLNRHEYLNKLILAYYIENKDIYIEKWKHLVLNWIDNNEIKLEGGKTIRTIDTGIRCQSWINSLMHIINEDKINDEELLKIILSIKEQLLYLNKAYIDKYILSNWGVLQTTAIMNCYLLFKDFIQNEELFNWALEETYKQMDIQVFDDGSHWEQSVMYHVEVLNCSMKVISMCEKFNFNLNNDYKEKVHSMARYLMYCGGPKSTQEAQCDSDRTDIRDVLVKAAILFKDEELKGMSFNKIDLSSIYMFGKNGYDKFEAIKGKIPKERNKSFIDSGNIYLRSDFKEDASFTYIQNGTLGSGHGHTDLGHFSIYYKGEPFLIDSGRYTYVEDDIMREFLKSAKAHNVSVIDDEPFGIPNKSWGYNKYGDVLKNYFINKENINYAEIAYLGELKDKTQYTVIRKILFIEPKIWVIVNEIRCTGEHNCKNYYVLDNNVKIEKRDDYLVAVNNSRKIKLYNYNIDKLNIKNTYISKNYNEIQNSKRIETNTKFNGKLINYDIIIGDEGFEDIIIKDGVLKQYNSKEQVSLERAMVKNIIVSDEEEYVVVIFNEETYKGGKVYFYDKTPIYGKVVVIHKNKGMSKVIRLKG
ncbi:heparinase II/III family protein [Clostridium chauvoei]|uniref:Heparinase II/III family protein n=2 Tax=Clostridium chauvoei TaxID=46867 RepID=A0ABD4RHC4_9CLOT|nr:heparinase II/III family protein [Clostridium chauvoei]ATD55782.1 heparinase [Clostridium chauvoei]ATD56543.1 heparinase [Clostridium chauvoei]MBX7280328.1 heparinase II/III family protein [Clostridium chauvoei]MBX7282813.1 heparinase II/III family protein [Clostridium chauvoei]MBX7285219.1 heparinase II/III family protein [Clostridium chauvoei]